MLTIAGFFTSPEELAKAAGININLWLGIFMLLVGIFFLVWARLSPQKPPEPNLDGTRPANAHALTHRMITTCAAAKPSAAAAVPAMSMPSPLHAAAT